MSWKIGLLISLAVSVLGSCFTPLPQIWWAGVALGAVVFFYEEWGNNDTKQKDNPFDVSDIIHGIECGSLDGVRGYDRDNPDLPVHLGDDRHVEPI